MVIEIEMKARVDKPEKTRAIMDEKLVYKGKFGKEDAYWLQEPSSIGEKSPFGIRIRKESFTNPQDEVSNTVIATYKFKKVSDGIEINDEKEFTLGGIEEFEGFLHLLGLKKTHNKRKKGFSYTKNDLTAELCEVEGLGWFVEIEILKDNKLEETVSDTRKRLFDCLAELGIGKEAIETRFYSEMLANEQ